MPSGSDAVVRDATGAVVSSGKPRVDGKKAEMQVPVKQLSPGKYRVEWYATSPDKHPNQGSFNFVVGNSPRRRAVTTRKASSSYASAKNRAAVRLHRRH